MGLYFWRGCHNRQQACRLSRGFRKRSRTHCKAPTAVALESGEEQEDFRYQIPMARESPAGGSLAKASWSNANASKIKYRLGCIPLGGYSALLGPPEPQRHLQTRGRAMEQYSLTGASSGGPGSGATSSANIRGSGWDEVQRPVICAATFCCTGLDPGRLAGIARRVAPAVAGAVGLPNALCKCQNHLPLRLDTLDTTGATSLCPPCTLSDRS